MTRRFLMELPCCEDCLFYSNLSIKKLKSLALPVEAVSDHAAAQMKNLQ